MKFFHISDLHIGKRVCGFSMLEDQREILMQILQLAGEQRPDGILIAGDLYDKSLPSAEAVELADWFLSELARRKILVWAISGNHDCAERIAYGSRMMEQAGIYMSRVFDGEVQRYTVARGQDGVVRVVGACAEETDDVKTGDAERSDAKMGKKAGADQELADIYLLPYVKPAQVRRFFPEQPIETTQDAVAAIFGSLTLKKDRTNILLMHQFMAGASVCDSEEISVGGSDQVSAAVVDEFDYVALGHLHGPQRVGRETVRYCGSPLKYSFSEAGHRKSVTVITFSEKEHMKYKMAQQRSQDEERRLGEPQMGETEFLEQPEIYRETEASEQPTICIKTIPLTPRRDLRKIRGPIAQLLASEVYCETNTEDYLHITLTDENPIIDAIGKLREVYPNIMRLDFESGREAEDVQEEIVIEEKSPRELFEEFFLRQNGKELSEAQRAVIDEIWELHSGGEGTGDLNKTADVEKGTRDLGKAADVEKRTLEKDEKGGERA